MTNGDRIVWRKKPSKGPILWPGFTFYRYRRLWLVRKQLWCQMLSQFSYCVLQRILSWGQTLICCGHKIIGTFSCGFHAENIKILLNKIVYLKQKEKQTLTRQLLRNLMSQMTSFQVQVFSVFPFLLALSVKELSLGWLSSILLSRQCIVNSKILIYEIIESFHSV